MNILITGAGGSSGLSSIRILKGANNIVAADCDPGASGLSTAHHQEIIPCASDINFVKSIQNIVEKFNIDVILPQPDEELKIFAANRESVPEALVSPLKTIDICADKLKTLKYFKDIIATPRIYSEIKLISDEDFPIFVKPRISRGSRNIYLVEDKRQLLSLLSYLDSIGFSFTSLLLTEYLPGIEYTVEVVCDMKGNYLTAVPRIRHSVKGGVCSVGEVVKNEKLTNIVKKIVKNLVFFGPINIQFKEDKFGEFKIMEINPRIAGATPISYKCGVNIPLLAVKLFMGEDIKKEELCFKEEKVFRYLTEV